MKSSLATASIIACGVFLFSNAAKADSQAPSTAGSATPAPAPPPQAPAAPAAPDLVLLKNGGLVRGTISEMTPGDTVVIVTVSGVTKHISMDEVTYAGPADKAPRSPAQRTDSEIPSPANASLPAIDHTRPFITVEGKAVPFHFVGDEPGLTLHLKTGDAEAVGWVGQPMGISAVSYTPICTAPCNATLPEGTHQLAVSKGDGSPVPALQPLTLREPSTIEATYQSNAGIRAGGWIIGIGGVVAGTAIMLSGGHTTTTSCPSSDPYCVPQTSVDTSPIYVGLGIIGASVLVGAILALQKDTAHVSIKPRAATANDESRTSAASRGGEATYQSAAISSGLSARR